MTGSAGRRGERVLALAAVGAGALVVLVAAQQPRVAVAGATPSGGTPAATALGLVVLAGAGALLLVRGWARTVIGALLLAAAVGIVVAGLDRPDTWFAYTGRPDVTPHRSVWAWLVAAGGMLIGLGALIVAVRGRGWPDPGGRYDAAAPAGPGGRAGAEARAGGAARAEGEARAEPSGRAAWDALDRGEDPTA